MEHMKVIGVTVESDEDANSPILRYLCVYKWSFEKPKINTGDTGQFVK